MKASRVVFNTEDRTVAAAGQLTGEEPVEVAEARDIDIVAGDDVRVRTRADCVIVEPLNDHPLLLRYASGGDVVRIWTQFEPDAPVEMGGVKDGAAVKPPRE